MINKLLVSKFTIFNNFTLSQSNIIDIKSREICILKNKSNRLGIFVHLQGPV